MIRFGILMMLLFVFLTASSQYRTDRYDTTYYVSYRNKLNLGVLNLSKNILFKMNAAEADKALRYNANSPIRLGISANHDFLTLSGSIGLGSIDPGFSDEKGQTR